MKKLSLFSKCLIPLGMLTTGLNLHAQSDEWTFMVMATPTALREGYLNSATGQLRISSDSADSAGNNEELVDLFFNGEFTVFGGEVSGAAKITGSRTATLAIGGQQHNFLVNRSGDVLTRAQFNDDGEQEFAVVIKKPTDAQTSELAGTWHFLDFGTPRDLTETYFNSETEETRSAPSSSDYAMEGEELVDVFFRGEFAALAGTINVNTSGGISGDLTGSLNTSSDGTVNMNVGDGSGPFHLNASKNFMARVLDEAEDDEQRMTVIIRAPSATTLADLAGAWRFTKLMVPNRLREAYFNRLTEETRQSTDSSDFAQANEELADVHFPGVFEVSNGVMGIGTDGRLAGAVSGSVSVAGPGTMTASINGEDFTFHVNAAHDVMWAVVSGADEQELIAIERVPIEPGKLVLDIENGEIHVLWEGRTDVKLQKTGDLFDWSDVSDSTGQSAFAAEASATAEFYRLIQLP